MSANDETAWESEKLVGGFEINGIERCLSKSLRRGTEQRVRRWQRLQRENGHETKKQRTVHLRQSR